MTPQELKSSILHLAFHGNLVPQIDSERITDKLAFCVDDTPFETPDSWKWNSIGCCCSMYTGNSISESEKKIKYLGRKEGYDYIGTKDVFFDHSINYNNGIRIPFETNFKIGFKGAVLMCIEGGSAGRKIAILDKDVCFGNKLCMFKTESILNTFLYYYFQSMEFKKAFTDNITGIIGGVSIKKLKSILIPIPPLAEQKRIVAKIEELLHYIGRYEKAWSKLEDFNKRFPADMQKSVLQMAIQGKLVEQRVEEGTAEELYQQILEEKQRLIKEGKIKKGKPLPEIIEGEIPFDIPSSWKWLRLEKLLLVQPSNGLSPKGVDYQTHYRNLTLTATTSGYFKHDAFKYVDILAEVAEKYYLKDEDILIQRSNSRELVGTSCVYRHGNNLFIYPDLMMRVHLFDRINVDYIDYVLKSPYCRLFFQESASGTSKSMPKITQNIVKKTLIPLPPLAEQKRIVQKLKEILPLCENLK